MHSLAVILFLCISAAFAQKDPNFVSGRSTIVHMFEWKWDGIADECERFLGVAGYGGVQISPPNENLVIEGRPWWERYQPVSYILTTRSGNESALADMIRRCNAVGVRIYADIVINHMTAGSGNGTAGSTADRSNKNYPAVPYGNDDFHPSCDVNNYDDANNVRNCELARLADLNQTIPSVRGKITDYMNHLIDLGVAGFRVDAAKDMSPDDLGAIYSGLKNLNTDHGFSAGARPFIYQEVIDFGHEAVKKEEYISIGAVLEFQYGLSLGNVCQGYDKLTNLRNWGPEWGLLNSSDAVAFIDNPDNQRNGGDLILTFKKAKLYSMATAFMLAHPYGTTRIMSSYGFDDNDQGPPQVHRGDIVPHLIFPNSYCGSGYVCEHRWLYVYQMVAFRNTAGTAGIENWWSNGDQQIAFSRGDRAFIAITTSGEINEHLNTGLPAGTYCDVYSGIIENGACTRKTITVDSDGFADISLNSGFDNVSVVAIHVNARV